MKKILWISALSMLTTASFSQKTDYSDVTLTLQQPPTLTRYKEFKTFDLSVITTKDQQDAPGTGFNVDYDITEGGLTQVKKDGDFHVVTVLYRYGGKLLSPSSAQANVMAISTVYDKYGNLVVTGTVNNENFPVSFGKPLSKEETANADLIRKAVMAKVIEATLRPLFNGINGASVQTIVRIASLDDVKKKPELKVFDDQAKILKPALEKGNFAGFKTAADPFVPYWEQMSTYAGEGNADEVKRAALNNLIIYHVGAGNFTKATEYLEAYKPIDKEVKQMFGLIRFRNSEELEKLVAQLQPARTNDIPITGTNITSKEQVLESHQYLTVKGSGTVSAKKEEGNYTGTFRIKKIVPATSGGTFNLDPENIEVLITTVDANGQPKIINTNISKITNLKDDEGNLYSSQKFGSALLGDAQYIFLKSSFVSPKVVVYRAAFPAGNDYVIKKAGDNDGIKSSLFGARKKLEEYFSDCASLSAKFKSGTIDKNMTAEAIADIYTKCE